MIQKIIQSGEKKLREISKPVDKFDKKIIALIQNLKDTLAIQNDPEGVGLAAPQIGINLRAFVTNFKNLKRVVVNPKILEINNSLPVTRNKKAKSEILEGCLSLPHYYGPLKREDTVKLKYLDENQKEIIEEFNGFNAQIILHEIDHLNGKLFVDRLLEQKKKLYKLDKNDEWEEIEI
ncbi:MAG: Peptide deformylase [Candidatus Woesebacteria bacterium GW2011_GWA1_33_30]|uniref:Peptide deformylase n=1 Tax=Candidatus Woesebacteria bacterium GW2011_GWA2_33_28 TaxID=1618561 RepID=A0A0G0A9D5_9BACT|nr:MAG: Peptide deformylase [Candidatus Woesebacteria bacterium GW2011_GWA2_33_28]KKP48764.1 MAG: Peptide deformylase [Candidatus Woesebacteria bacterium GW2011_GWA1_33_30]KKP50037.1 MAG: Peptide deformylase [Microgenomates group bacterium GW2011_GWC1_33_32]KKP51808.1 MAG: Peptide deformylase [Candidatus Woesebacteria bacterium GW2011_GWB1_33_38]KKP58578.1 MAG: Peptide deformylase [Microgenomates group bacterium GW2011_GWD1_33_9]